jgi:hypothetical protein
MNDFELNQRPQLPVWMKINHAGDFPEKWLVLTETFLKTVELLLLLKPPEIAFINFDEFQGQMQIEFDARPFLTRRHAGLIDRAIADYKKMAWSMRTDDQMPFDTQDLFTEKCFKVQKSKLKSALPRKARSDCQEETADVRNEKQIVVFGNLVSEAEAEAAAASRDSDVRTRYKKIMVSLFESGPTRPFRLPAPDWQVELDALAEKFPNFERVISSVIRPHLALVTHGGLGAHRMQPIFLLGSSGCGKNAFTRSLQKIFNVTKPLHIVIAAETNGMSLGGSSTFFSNSSPGLLFERLAYPINGHGPIANPIVVIDEVEKSRTKDFDPLASLYSLLEEDTAAVFEDQALPGISIDTSFVRFILLGNESSIPEPILSRVLTFEIEPLSACQLRKVSRSIFEEEVDKLGIIFDKNLPENVLDQAQGLSLRQCKIRFQSAIGIAVANQKNEIDMNSWSCSNNAVSSNRKIGFV